MQSNEVRPQRNIAVVKLSADRHRLSDALTTINEMTSWPYAPDVPPPNRSSQTRARELVLAIGPLAPGGPLHVVLAPSIKGGVVVTFVTEARDVTVASMNNHRSVLVVGKGSTVELQVDVTHAEALERVQALCGD